MIQPEEDIRALDRDAVLELRKLDEPVSIAHPETGTARAVETQIEPLDAQKLRVGRDEIPQPLCDRPTACTTSTMRRPSSSSVGPTASSGAS